MNAKTTIKKLQTALMQKNFIVKLNSKQFYSKEQHRLIYIYILTTPITYFNKRQEKWKIKDYEIISTCSIIEVLKTMVEINKGVAKWN